MVLRFKLSHLASALLGVCLILFVAAMLPQGDQKSAVKVAASTFDNQPAAEKALIYLFLDRIREQSNLFYEPYYTASPTVAYYFTTVKEIEEAEILYLTFTSRPYLGPHDSVGEDEITFSVTRAGEITPVEFRHLKSYPLPENLGHLEIGALPPVSQ